jgi:hypothetical protein
MARGLVQRTLARTEAFWRPRARFRCFVCCWPFVAEDSGYAVEYVPEGQSEAAKPVLIHQRCLVTWLVARTAEN